MLQGLLIALFLTSASVASAGGSRYQGTAPQTPEIVLHLEVLEPFRFNNPYPRATSIGLTFVGTEYPYPGTSSYPTVPSCTVSMEVEATTEISMPPGQLSLRQLVPYSPSVFSHENSVNNRSVGIQCWLNWGMEGHHYSLLHASQFTPDLIANVFKGKMRMLVNGPGRF